MLAQLKAENFHVVTITDLHIAHAPHQKYAPYDSGIAGDQFVKNPNGSVYVGDVWPGPSVFPDFTRQQTREWFGTLYRDFYRQGVSGFWDDMNEPSVFHTVSGHNAPGCRSSDRRARFLEAHRNPCRDTQRIRYGERARDL